MEENKYISFTERKTPLYPSYRPMYKVAQILLILHYNGFAGKASLLKLHLITWAFKSIENRQTLLAFISNSNNSIQILSAQLYVIMKDFCYREILHTIETYEWNTYHAHRFIL